jgi:formate hydrogenlyase subunit 6/NADH:ubiquinone oxidoreductase subunit I
MGSFHLTKMSFRNLFKKPATKMYPVVTPTYTARTKGHVVCNISDCILCSICEKRCPTHAITVDKPGESWTIDNFSCIQCLSCVRICPRKCLTMEPSYTKAALEKSSVTTKKPELTAEEKAAKAAAEAEKAERIAKAKAAKAARDAAAAEGAGAVAAGAVAAGNAKDAAGDTTEGVASAAKATEVAETNEPTPEA